MRCRDSGCCAPVFTFAYRVLAGPFDPRDTAPILSAAQSLRASLVSIQSDLGTVVATVGAESTAFTNAIASLLALLTDQQTLFGPEQAQSLVCPSQLNSTLADDFFPDPTVYANVNPSTLPACGAVDDSLTVEQSPIGPVCCFPSLNGTLQFAGSSLGY